MARRTALVAGVAALAAAVVLGGCSSSGGADAGDGTIRVVASTNVYGDIARQIGGDRVSVTSIIEDPSQDPHSYEADTRTQLALSKADVVIKNGGGYDDFVTSMLNAGDGDATVLDAVTISGDTAPAGGELNEHVWYDFAAMRKLVARLVSALSKAEPAGADSFRAHARKFDAQLDTLVATEASLKKSYAGKGVAITEPVPLYLLQACGLVNRTPAAFSEAIEEGEDVSVGVLDQTLQLFDRREVSLLAYNEQTSGAETEKVQAAAKANGIAVVPVTETLPEGKDYVSWMTANLAAVKAALA